MKLYSKMDISYMIWGSRQLKYQRRLAFITKALNIKPDKVIERKNYYSHKKFLRIKKEAEIRASNIRCKKPTKKTIKNRVSGNKVLNPWGFHVDEATGSYHRISII